MEDRTSAGLYLERVPLWLTTSPADDIATLQKQKLARSGRMLRFDRVSDGALYQVFYTSDLGAEHPFRDRRALAHPGPRGQWFALPPLRVLMLPRMKLEGWSFAIRRALAPSSAGVP